MTKYTEGFKNLGRKLFTLFNKRKNVLVPKECDEDTTSLEKWKPYLKDYKYTFWNEELKRPVSLAIRPGSREEYLWNHPEEVRRILLEHGVDPDDDSTLGVINIGKKEDTPTEEDRWNVPFHPSRIGTPKNKSACELSEDM